jgi:hypothetical protein
MIKVLNNFLFLFFAGGALYYSMIKQDYVHATYMMTWAILVKLKDNER